MPAPLADCISVLCDTIRAGRKRTLSLSNLRETGALGLLCDSLENEAATALLTEVSATAFGRRHLARCGLNACLLEKWGRAATLGGTPCVGVAALSHLSINMASYDPKFYADNLGHLLEGSPSQAVVAPLLFVLSNLHIQAFPNIDSHATACLVRNLDNPAMARLLLRASLASHTVRETLCRDHLSSLFEALSKGGTLQEVNVFASILLSISKCPSFALRLDQVKTLLSLDSSLLDALSDVLFVALSKEEAYFPLFCEEGVLRRLFADAEHAATTGPCRLLLQLAAHPLGLCAVEREDLVPYVTQLLSRTPSLFQYHLPDPTVLALDRVLYIGKVFGLSDDELQTWRLQRNAIEAEAKEASLLSKSGIEGTPFPAEFFCPITHERMHDPVVASDGHTYEREAIQRVLLGSRTSPMTRETLHPFLFSNIALRLRMESHVEDVCSAVGRAMGRAAGREGERKRARREEAEA